MKILCKTHITKLIAIALLSLPVHANADEVPKWPNGAKAAVSLTYDDSLMSHLETAIPALDKHGLKGTFYLTVSAPVFTDRMDEWREVAKTGHELGSHSIYHPCRGSDTNPGRDWIVPERNLNSYTVPRMVQELTLANALLKAVDGKATRSYAYPCGESAAGGESYVEAIKPLFVGARSVNGGVVKFSDIENTAFALPTFNGENKTGKELIAMVDEIIASGGYGTIMFHGVGGDYITVSAKAHKKLAAYLAKRKKDIWVDTVREVTTYYNERQGVKD